MRAKKIRSLSYLLLMFILCFCPICNVSATEPDQAKANLVTDKEKYNESEQIRATFTLESDETLNDIQVNFSDLKGYEQKVTIDNTKKSYQTVYTPEKKGWFASKTGDTSKWILYLISFCIATIFILIIMKKKKRFLSLFVIISILLTAVPFSGKEVLANDTGKILTKQIIIGKETKEFTVHYKYSVHMDTTVDGKKIKVDFESNGVVSLKRLLNQSNLKSWSSKMIKKSLEAYFFTLNNKIVFCKKQFQNMSVFCFVSTEIV